MGYKDFSVSILISTYNWPEALELIFKSLINQTLQPHEVLIADDGSNTQTTELIEKYRDIMNLPIRHAWQEDLGFRKSLILNKAVKLSTSDYIIEIDGDILLHPNFIRDHVKNAAPSKFVQGSRCQVNLKTTEEIISGNRKSLSFISEGVKNRFNGMRIPFFKSWFQYQTVQLLLVKIVSNLETCLLIWASPRYSRNKKPPKRLVAATPYYPQFNGR
jgi:glycosyltransferase involved in cell wall biosynthesis